MLAAQGFDPGRPWCVIADRDVLAQRADQLRLSVEIATVTERELAQSAIASAAGRLALLPRDAGAAVTPGQPTAATASHVLGALSDAVDHVRAGRCAALITGPIQKSVINDAGIAFTGHTEAVAHQLGVQMPVMMLAGPTLRVALVTTHLPLSAVPAAITRQRVASTVRIVAADLTRRFGIARPRIVVTGLNPHAGEGGHLGHEDDAQIAPAVAELRADGLDVTGPLPADTAFGAPARAHTDAFVAMYHDQGLAVVKALDFGEVVNITLGLPIVRTSVDHGTALDLAGTGRASTQSLAVAMRMAARMSPPSAGS